MSKEINVPQEVVLVKYFMMVFESDAETVVGVLASMEQDARESLIDAVMADDLNDAQLLEVREKFNEQVELLKS